MWTTLVHVKAAHQVYEYPADADFSRTVREVATRMGWSLFTVYVGGQEVLPSTAPATLGEARGEIVIHPYQTAAA